MAGESSFVSLLDITMVTAFLVLSSFFRPECSGYCHVRRGRQFLPMSRLCFSQIHSRSSCSDARSCGKPDLLINSCSCTSPKCWLRCHFFNWSSMLLLHSENFVNLNVVSPQNDPPPPRVSNKHLFSVIGVYLKLLLLDRFCRHSLSVLTPLFRHGTSALCPCRRPTLSLSSFPKTGVYICRC